MIPDHLGCSNKVISDPKSDPGPFGMLKQVFLARFDPVYNNNTSPFRFGHCPFPSTSH